MAPIQQQINESSCIKTNDTASSKHMKLSKSQSSTSSCVSNSSSTSFDSSSNNSRRSSLEGRTSMMEWPKEMQDSLLPITIRGPFYNDSFFEDARKHFDEAVKEVLEQWGQRSDQLDDLTSYRKLREFDVQEKNQAISVSEDETSHKVVLDVRDFIKGDIKVKVIDENELVVEGSFEKQDGTCVSKKSFRRSFTFPGLVKADAVSSAMSSDGVLTVTVPKNNQRRVSSKLTNTQTTKSTDSVSSKSSEEKSVHEGNNLSSKSIFDDVKSDFLLPITKRGLFFQDSFFESAREDFEKSVQEVLEKFGEKETMKEDNMSSYRRLREKNLKQENQAVSVTEEEGHHKVVLDVKDFVSGDVKVKIVNEDELTVEGKVEQQNGGTTSRKSFYRSFTFPGLIKSNAITSAMSSDGILTIKVPKNKETNSLSNSSSFQSLHSGKKQQISSKVFGTKTVSQKSDTNRKLVGESVNANELKDMYSESLLPIFQKGLFFHDDFFASAHQDFERAVNEVLNRCVETSSIRDNMTTYRTLRERDLKDENQAVTTSEDHQCHKVVIDVRDFMHNDLKVKMVDENELVVEGKVEKKEGGSVSMKNFCRSFIFPGLVNSEAVSSTMSSDGVLIITVPKKKVQQQNGSQIVQSLENDESKVLSASQNSSSRLESKQQVSSQSMQKFSMRTSRNQVHDLNQKSSETILRQENNGDLLPSSNVKNSSSDNFIAEAKRDFENIVKKVVNNSDESSVAAQKMNKNLSEEISVKENQSVSISEDDVSHKVKIDVSDFVGGDLQVKAVEKNELLVEGRLEKDQAGKTSSKSFNRRVQLPGTIKVDGITSVLSKDGILLITAPKDLKDSKESNSTLRSETIVESHESNGSAISNSHKTHSEQRKVVTSGAKSSNYSHSITSQQFTSTLH